MWCINHPHIYSCIVHLLYTVVLDVFLAQAKRKAACALPCCFLELVAFGGEHTQFNYKICGFFL